MAELFLMHPVVTFFSTLPTVWISAIVQGPFHTSYTLGYIEILVRQIRLHVHIYNHMISILKQIKDAMSYLLGKTIILLILQTVQVYFVSPVYHIL